MNESRGFENLLQEILVLSTIVQLKHFLGSQWQSKGRYTVIVILFVFFARYELFADGKDVTVNCFFH